MTHLVEQMPAQRYGSVLLVSTEGPMRHLIGPLPQYDSLQALHSLVNYDLLEGKADI